MNREKLTEELAGWIDTDTIAQHLIEELEEQGISPTLEDAKTVWLDVLETELCQAIRNSIKYKLAN